MTTRTEAEALMAGGRMAEAGRVLSKALAGKADADLLSLRATLFYRLRRYPASLRDVEKAISLTPRDAALRAQRAEVLAQVGRTGEAAREIDAALRLRPGDEALELASLRLAPASGLLAKAERLAARSEDARQFLGYLRLKSGDAAGAQREFLSVMRQAPAGSPLALRARFYWIASRARAQASERPRIPQTKLYIVGLGLFPPYTASLETLRTVSRCDVLLNNVSGPETQEFLEALAPVVRPSAMDSVQDEHRWAEEVIDGVGPGMSAAFVTRGHPLVFGGLGLCLLEEARRQGVATETQACYSSLDSLTSGVAARIGRGTGAYQALEYTEVLPRAVKPSVPLLIYFYQTVSGKPLAEFLRRLRSIYLKNHTCLVFGPKYDVEPTLETVAGLSKRPAIDPSLVLYLPPL
jgi:Flp pilus assembly protein TadD